MNVGKNDLCPCGSGKKYKKCCFEKEKLEKARRLLASLEEEDGPEMLSFKKFPLWT